ncbi:MAG: type II toxin-antitoxin system RatA family toxin [Alphaproteobacteria bacterium]|nr:type II toxin-antitoxin system RatA family toxin [Alphaproteobacteria bacterium]
MTAHHETRLVPYSADLMYEVVADVEHYPQFLPWCMGLRLLSRSQNGEREIVTAEMLVGFKAFRERYTSRIVLDPAARTIAVSQTEGVFRYLRNNWAFTPEGKMCRVDFSIEFEFKSRLLGAIAGQAFAHVLTRMSDAFEARARVVAASSPDQSGSPQTA